MIPLRVVPRPLPLGGYRAETDAEHSFFGLWLDGDVRGGGDDYDIEELWRQIGAALRRQGPKVSSTSDFFTVRLERGQIEIWAAPILGAKHPLVMSVDDFADATQRWFDVVAPAVAVALRAIRGTWPESPRYGGGMDVHVIHGMIDALLALPSSEPADVARVLGVSLTLVESKRGYDSYTATFAGGPFATAEHGNRAGMGAGQLKLVPRENLLDSWQLGLDRYGRGSLEHTTTGFDGHMSHCYAFDDRRRELRWGFRGGCIFDSVVVRWGPPKYAPGDEPVFASAPPVIRLTSYDVHGDTIEYVPATRTWRAAQTAGAATFGAFTREGEQVAAVFATPAGPAVVVNGKRVLAVRGQTSAQVTRAGQRMRFQVFQNSNVIGELLYTERHGIGTNPYDQEPADVDLLALIAAGLGREQFYQGYTKPWVTD